MIARTPDSELLALTTVAQGTRGGPREATEVVLRNQDALIDFFGGEFPAVDIDWDTEVVTAVALGQRPHTGYGVTIESIRFYTLGIRGGTADVTYREEIAEVGGSALTYPFHAVRSKVYGQAFFRRLGDEDLPPALFGDWRGPVAVSDHEVATYVPRSKAEPSRSVAGFVIFPDGAFTKVDDDLGDGPVEVPGRWTATSDGIHVELTDRRGFILTIVTVEEDRLRVRQQPLLS